jgi:hypothetical protein
VNATNVGVRRRKHKLASCAGCGGWLRLDNVQMFLELPGFRFQPQFQTGGISRFYLPRVLAFVVTVGDAEITMMVP